MMIHFKYNIIKLTLLLAYDLYEINKDSTDTPVKNIKPFKKIFMCNNKISVDETLREKYGSSLIENKRDVKIIQDWLSMPLNTTNPKMTQMIDLTIHSSQKSPYLIFYCTLQIKKIQNDDMQAIMIVSCGKEPSICQAEYDLITGKTTFKENDIKIRINTDDYFAGEQNLFSAYQNESILTSDGTLKAATFKKIVTVFFKYIKTRSELDYESIKKVSFPLYILPTRLTIEKKSLTNNKQSEFIDVFGNHATLYPSKTTVTAKFLSYDDPAFTINCKREESFYKDLGIGNYSLDKINFPASHITKISKIEWIFIDINNITKSFEQIRQGFLKQIHYNYKKLDNNPASNKKSNLKVIGMIRDKYKMKIEILLDENLTMNKLEQMFHDMPLDKQDIPFMVFEIMIPAGTENKKTLWADYIYTIRSFLTGRKISKYYFVRFFTKELKKQLKEFLKSKNTAVNFFLKSEFMIKYISSHVMNDDLMNNDETFAFSIGSIARAYIDYRRKNKEENNSLDEILKYSKYDKLRLQHVLTKVGKGIAISKTDSETIQKIETNIQKLISKNEITDDKTDYAYFFYKGYFTGE